MRAGNAKSYDEVSIAITAPVVPAAGAPGAKPLDTPGLGAEDDAGEDAGEEL